jgi:hypothetical protein
MLVRRAVLVAAAATVLAAAPAAAHTDLVSSSPKQGAELKAAPQRVTLTFGEDLLPAGDRLVARTAEGAQVDLGPSTVTGAELSAEWPQSAASGEYRVAYRAVASDGHPLEGTVSFTITATQASSQPSPAAAEAPAPAEPADQEGSNALRLWAPLALIAALLVAGVFMWRSRAQ